MSCPWFGGSLGDTFLSPLPLCEITPHRLCRVLRKVLGASTQAEHSPFLYWVPQIRRQRAQHPDDPLGADDKSHKSARAAVFADWLIETFGNETLSRYVWLSPLHLRGETSMTCCPVT